MCKASSTMYNGSYDLSNSCHVEYEKIQVALVMVTMFYYYCDGVLFKHGLEVLEREEIISKW